MTDIKALATERVRLNATLDGIRMWNTAGQTLDAMIEVEIRAIETRRRLAEINREIEAYERGEG